MIAHVALRALRTLRSISFIRGLQVLVRALIDTFRSAIVEEINAQVCPECQLTTDNIRDHEFSCHGLTKHIVYRAMVVGTKVRTAVDLVSLIQSWVDSGRASITALSIRLHLDKDCSTVVYNLDEPVCPLQIESTTQPSHIKESTPSIQIV